MDVSAPLALIGAAALMGLAGAPHCAAMCGPACTALTVRRRETPEPTGGGRVIPIVAATPGDAGVLQPAVQGSPTAGLVPALALPFHLLRIGGYALAGALAAAGVDWIGTVGRSAGATRPLWTMLQMAALLLGLWLLLTGRQPAFLANLGRNRVPARNAVGAQRSAVGNVGAQSQGDCDGNRASWRGIAVATGAGAAWVAWPCGLLQSAIVVAALANDAAGGALTMAAFGFTSAAGLLAVPWLAARGLGASTGWAVRMAGALLAGSALWALGHGLWMRVAAYCGF